MAGAVDVARAVAALILLTFISSFPALGDEVRLRLKGGDFEIVGDLAAFDGTTYLVIAPLVGPMKIDAARFECLGDACPKVPEKKIAANMALPVGGGSFAIAGSGTIGNGLMPALIEAYAEASGLTMTQAPGADPEGLTVKLSPIQGRTAATIDLRRQGSSTAFKELRAGTAEIGMASRPIKDQEVADFAAAGFGNMRDAAHEHILALDGLVVLVAPDNPLVSISVANLASIFAGDITNWSELGGADLPINLYAPQEGSGTLDTFQSLVLEPNGRQLSASVKRADHAERSDWVSADPGGITFAGIAYVRDAKAVNIEASCGLISRPSHFAMKTEEYPLTRRLYLYTRGRPASPFASRFLDFALSDQAQPSVVRNGFIDQSPEHLDFRDQGARIAYALNAQDEDFNLTTMRELISEISHAQRLTTTLRFNLASSVLDAKSRRDVERLVDILKSPTYAGRQVLVLGFSDAVGAYDKNMKLSYDRAKAVLDLLLAAGVTNAVATGYGELAPVTCNDTPESRNSNRRVEIWVK